MWGEIDKTIIILNICLILRLVSFIWSFGHMGAPKKKKKRTETTTFCMPTRTVRHRNDLKLYDQIIRLIGIHYNIISFYYENKMCIHMG